MLKTKAGIVSKIHLIVSVAIVVPVAIIYGFQPDVLFDIHPNTADEHNAFKAIMGLYIGCSILWILGIFKTALLKTAVCSHIVFMMGLALGRFISIAIDGTPSALYVFGAFAELFLAAYGIWVLKYILRTNFSK